MPLIAGCDGGPFGFVVGILDAKGALLARSTELFSEGTHGNVVPEPYRIDIARFKISASETAFGVRVVHLEVTEGSCYADQVLHLFRVVGKDVVRVLTTDSFYEQFEQGAHGRTSPPGAVPAGASARIVYRRTTWTMAADAKDFALVPRKRGRH